MRLSRANTGFWLVWLVALLWCFINSFDDPSSIFFGRGRAYKRSYSATREIEALASLERAASKPQIETSTKAKINEFLCVGIPTVNRTFNSFLETSLGSLTDTLSEAERASIHIIVLLADEDPRTHISYGAPWLTRLADDVLVYEFNGDTDVYPIVEPDVAYREIPRNLREDARRGKSRWENVQLDHSVLVEACQKHGSPYFAMVQDDVIASRDWLQRLWRGVAQLENMPKENERDWLYLRLFHSEKLMGWNNEEVLGYLKIVAVAYMLAGVVFLVTTRCFRRRRATRHRHYKNNAASLLSPQTHSFSYIASLALGLWIPAFIALFFLAGRVTLHRLTHWQPYVRPMPEYGCCAQGLVFPQRHLDGLLGLLREPPYHFAVDMVVEGHAASKNLNKWALDPSILQHLGRFESTDEGKVSDVWNFSFERLR